MQNVRCMYLYCHCQLSTANVHYLQIYYHEYKKVVTKLKNILSHLHHELSNIGTVYCIIG